MASGCSIPLYVVKKLVSGCPTPSVVDHMSEYFTSVDAFPVHRIVRHFVELVPCQFGRHEVVNSAFFKICGIAALYPKTSGSHRILLSTPNSSLKKRFPNRNWRTRDSPEVRLQSASTHMPAFRLPASFFDSLADFLVHFRVSFFDKAVELRLARHEVIVQGTPPSVLIPLQSFGRISDETWSIVHSHATSMRCGPIHVPRLHPSRPFFHRWLPGCIFQPLRSKRRTSLLYGLRRSSRLMVFVSSSFRIQTRFIVLVHAVPGPASEQMRS